MDETCLDSTSCIYVMLCALVSLLHFSLSFFSFSFLFLSTFFDLHLRYFSVFCFEVIWWSLFFFNFLIHVNIFLLYIILTLFCIYN